MTDIDDSTSPGDGSGGSGGSQVGITPGGITQGGAIPIVTGTSAMAGNGAGGYPTTVLPPTGGAAADYRCVTPLDTGTRCADESVFPSAAAVAFDPATGTCSLANFYGCGSTSVSATFETVGTCEAVCRAAPSSSTCNLEPPTPGSPCAPETELCIYLAISYNVPCLCSDYTCATQRCPGILPMVTTPSDSCTDDVCVAQLPIVLLEETKTVCRCESGLWSCEATYRYGGGL